MEIKKIYLPKKSEICSICLDSEPDTILKCQHTFHSMCIKKALKMNSKCPNCR